MLKHVYVYLRNSGNYRIITSNFIENFEYQRNGTQDKEFSEKTFIAEVDNKNTIIQILTVAG